MYINGALWIVREKKRSHNLLLPFDRKNVTILQHKKCQKWRYIQDFTHKCSFEQLSLMNESVLLVWLFWGKRMWNWQTYAAVDHLSSAFWPQRFGMHRPTDGIQKSSSSSFYGHKGVILFVGVIFPVDGETHHHHLGRKWFGGNLKRILRWHPKLIFSTEWSWWKMWQK